MKIRFRISELSNRKLFLALVLVFFLASFVLQALNVSLENYLALVLKDCKHIISSSNSSCARSGLVGQLNIAWMANNSLFDEVYSIVALT